MSDIDQLKRMTIAELRRQRTVGYVSAYANHIEATPGFYELALTFCTLERDVEGQPVSTQQATISLTWEHAARLRDLLVRLTEGYEREQGKIRSMKEPEEIEAKQD